MIRINRVVTRGGDSGQTSLGDGARVAKDTARIEAIGAVDEANAALGLLSVACAPDSEAAAMLSRIQNDLFDVGADLAVPGEDGARLRLTDAPCLRLEAEVTAMNANLAPLTSFVLPGGTEAAARAHIARTAARRAERALVHLEHEEALNPALLRFLNRLSDHLFVLARVLNDNGARDVPWQPGAGR